MPSATKKRSRKPTKKPVKKAKNALPTLKKVNWYGFSHVRVDKQFRGNLTFLNCFCVNGEYHPVTVYRAANPDLSKGHKTYLLLQVLSKEQGGGGMVRGMDEETMEKHRYQGGIHCLQCNAVVYSVNRHHMSYCGCKNKAFADGGKDYLRAGAMDMSKTRMVRIDLLTDQIVEVPDGDQFPR